MNQLPRCAKATPEFKPAKPLSIDEVCQRRGISCSEVPMLKLYDPENKLKKEDVR